MIIDQILNLPLNKADQNIIQSIRSQLTKKEVVIGLFGSFSVGKSELINRLIGHNNLLPTHVNETTAIPTIISAGEKEKIVVFSNNGEQITINQDELHNYVAGSKVDIIDKIEIQLTEPSWLNAIQFIDTPGRNTKYQSHIDASEAAILDSDAVLYVMPWQGLTMEDIVYIKKLLVYQPNLSFVINKVDRINESEGITIEQLTEKVASDLAVHLGKRYPVFALSAKTGFNIDKLLHECIQPIVKNVEKLKKDRFNHAVTQFLQRQKELLENDINFLELALTEDKNKIDSEKQKVQLEYSKVESQIAKELSQLQQLLKDSQIDMDRILNEEIVELTKNIEQILNQNMDASIGQVQLLIENLIVTSRQSIVSALTTRLDKILGQDLTFSLNPIESTDLTLNYTKMNYEELSRQFEAQKQQLIQRFESKSNQLKDLPQNTSETERVQLEEELQELTAQISEQYVPQMIKDDTHDPRKAEKILRGFGFLGDIVVAVGLAALTAGTSAAAQVGGKVAAKEATKAVAKKAASEAAKKAAKEAAIKAAKEKVKQEVVEKGIQLASGAMNRENLPTATYGSYAATDEIEKMKKGEQSPLQTAIKTLDAVTSPVETIAAKIGQTIDKNREPMEMENLDYRNRFFSKKYEVELQYQERVDKLRKLEQQAVDNEILRSQVEKKLENLQTELDGQLQLLEQQQQEAIEKQQKQHYKKQIDSQVMSIINEEKQNYGDWIKTEFNRIYQTVETMLPTHYFGELARWEVKLDEIDQMKQNQSLDGKSKTEELRAHLQSCVSLLESIYEVERV